MDMQDKEFDEAFRSKLDSFETEPTEQVWYGITEGLDGKRRYRALLPWLSIAASITVLAAAGILFIPKKGPENVKPGVKTGIVKAQAPEPVKRDTLPAPLKENIKPVAPVVNSMAHVKTTKAPVVNRANKPETAPVNDVIDESVVKQQEQPILAVVEPKQEPVNPVVPGNDIHLATQQTIDEQPEVTPPVVAINTAPAKIAAAPVKAKRKVHGIGGFLNTVIAAVDKRKDKIIEFGNSDDDESSNITAINLGVLKFKKATDSK